MPHSLFLTCCSDLPHSPPALLHAFHVSLTHGSRVSTSSPPHYDAERARPLLPRCHGDPPLPKYPPTRAHTHASCSRHSCGAVTSRPCSWRARAARLAASTKRLRLVLRHIDSPARGDLVTRLRPIRNSPPTLAPPSPTLHAEQNSVSARTAAAAAAAGVTAARERASERATRMSAAPITRAELRTYVVIILGEPSNRLALSRPARGAGLLKCEHTATDPAASSPLTGPGVRRGQMHRPAPTASIWSVGGHGRCVPLNSPEAAVPRDSPKFPGELHAEELATWPRSAKRDRCCRVLPEAGSPASLEEACLRDESNSTLITWGSGLRSSRGSLHDNYVATRALINTAGIRHPAAADDFACWSAVQKLSSCPGKAEGVAILAATAASHPGP